MLSAILIPSLLRCVSLVSHQMKGRGTPFNFYTVPSGVSSDLECQFNHVSWVRSYKKLLTTFMISYHSLLSILYKMLNINLFHVKRALFLLGYDKSWKNKTKLTDILLNRTYRSFINQSWSHYQCGYSRLKGNDFPLMNHNLVACLIMHGWSFPLLPHPLNNYQWKFFWKLTF